MSNRLESRWLLLILMIALLITSFILRAENLVEGMLLEDGDASFQQGWRGKDLESSTLFNGESDTVGKIHEEIDNLSEPPLVFQLNDAAARGDVPELNRLLVLGVPPDEAMTDTGMTPLMVSADARTAVILIKSGADVNRADLSGWTPLHHAVTRSDSLGLVVELLKNGADAGKRNDRGETPLLLTGLLFTEAIDPESGPSVIAHLVAEGKANINVWDDDGWTLLHQAASNDEPMLASSCLSAGADPDIVTPLQETPREMAERLKSIGFLRELPKFPKSTEKSSW